MFAALIPFIAAGVFVLGILVVYFGQTPAEIMAGVALALIAAGAIYWFIHETFIRGEPKSRKRQENSVGRGTKQHVVDQETFPPRHVVDLDGHHGHP